ncbi:ATP-binding cassette domain-containing protein [Chlorobium sp.]|uniref:ATP-binding cassette domain-containing protein n=1 Tax=Chlorobium sp. TaxID=1095 RepID=UPI0025C1BDA8|nr:ATP-binding cassette domain-containing protein [Chlorobium sp.]
MQQVPRLWLELLSVSGLVALVFSLLAQDKPLDTIVPRLGLFAVATFRIMPSVNRILNVLQILKFCLPVITILDKDFSQAINKNETETNGTITFNTSIKLKNISFSYPSASEKAIDGISLSIRRGESIAFIGASGSGKSTLADILLGLLSPDEGEILVDNTEIRTNIRSWQDKIGYVPQSIYLTDDNLLRNIAFGLPDDQIDVDAVWNAIRSANLETFIKNLPDGLDTMVGERGVRLSGGQRQRIGIARALYHNPEILLLDEATSALDNETEENVMHAVKLLRGTKTIIIIAHRLSTVEQCDYIYKLDNGKILVSGNADEILGKKDQDKA